jgi:hypothetical protein
MGWFSKLFAKKPDLTAIATAGEPEESPAPTEAAEGEAPGDDEDPMIETYKLHKNIKNLVIERLKAEGIDCKATTGNDPNGDILIIRKKDVVRVQEIIWGLNSGETPREAERSQGAKRVRRRRP